MKQASTKQTEQCFEDKISSPCRKNAVDAFEETPTDSSFYVRRRETKPWQMRDLREKTLYPEKKFS